jgi:mRNA interferase RelE/StbE
MHYKVQLIEEAREDFKKLDHSQKMQVSKQLKSLEINPHKGKRLGNKYGINLSGYLKLYAVKKQVRIVYTIKEKEILVEVISIGMREDFAVYKEAFRRIRKPV